MTNEEAIAIIENEKKCVNRANKNDYCNRDCYNCELVKTDTEILTALDLAIKALEQQPCDDAISRQAVDDAIYDYSRSCDVNYHQIMEFIEKIPSVTPQPKTGHWIFDEILDKHYYCSECKSMGVDYWDYCPNCGAKMESEVQE